MGSAASYNKALDASSLKLRAGGATDEGRNGGALDKSADADGPGVIAEVLSRGCVVLDFVHEEVWRKNVCRMARANSTVALLVFLRFNVEGCATDRALCLTLER